jgi:hypothetical protein
VTFSPFFSSFLVRAGQSAIDRRALRAARAPHRTPRQQRLAQGLHTRPGRYGSTSRRLICVAVHGLHREMTGLPPPVAAGSRVAIVFPAGRPGDDQSGLELLSQWGLEPVIHDAFGTRIKPPQPDSEDPEAAAAAHFMARCYNTCLPDEDRARALEEAFLDDSCDAVICGRGGYGCMRLLELLDWSKLTEAVLRKKRFVGFSDITALHLAFQTVAPGLVTLHGPMPASCFATITQPDADRLRAALFADAGGGAMAVLSPLAGLMLNDAGAPSPRPQCTRVLGRLVGGNLALLSVRASRSSVHPCIDDAPLPS